MHLNATSSDDYTNLITYYQVVDYNNIAVTFKDDVLKRFRAYLGNPKRGEEIHIHDLFIEFENAVDGKQTI